MLIKLEEIETGYNTRVSSGFEDTTVDINKKSHHEALYQSQIMSFKKNDSENDSRLIHNALPWKTDSKKKELTAIKELIKTIQEEPINKAMFEIYKTFMEWEMKSLFNYCDEVLGFVNDNSFDIRVIITLLMATNTMKPHLLNRDKLLDTARYNAKIIYSVDEYESIFKVF